MFEQFDVYEDDGYIEIQAVDFSSGIEVHGVAYGDVDGIGDFNLDYEVPYPSLGWEGSSRNIWEFHGQVQRSFIDFGDIEDSLERLIEDYAPTVPSWAYREWEMDKALADADEMNAFGTYEELIDALKSMGYSDEEAEEIYEYSLKNYWSVPPKEGSMKRRSEVIDWTGMNPYMLLSRMEGDCKYFLRNGNGYEGHLWAGNVQDHIDTMLAIYDKVVEKPEWITREQIEEYGEQMGWNKTAKVADIYWPETPSEEAYEWANNLTTEEWDSIRKFFDSIGCEVSFNGYGHADIWSSLQHSLDMGLLCDSDSMRYPESDGLWIAEDLLEKFNNSPVIGDWLYEIDHEYNVCLDGLDDVGDMYEPETEEWYEERENCIDRYFDKVFPIVENKLIPTLEQMAEEAYKMVDEYVDELAKGYMEDERRQWED